MKRWKVLGSEYIPLTSGQFQKGNKFHEFALYDSNLSN